METILIISGIVAVISFVLQWDLIAFCAGAITVIGTLITFLSNINVGLEQVLIFSTLTMIIWSAIFIFIRDMFK